VGLRTKHSFPDYIQGWNDCFTKGSRSCSTHVDWLNGFSFFIEKLSPYLINKRLLFIMSKSVFGKQIGLAVSIAEKRQPAANDFEENDHFCAVKLKNAKT
jgi:hypothetical protein